MFEPDDLTTALLSTLRQFHNATPGVLGSGVFSADGYALAADLPTTVDEYRVAGIAATMLALGAQTTEEFEQGALVRISIEGARGRVIVARAGACALLSAVVRQDAKLGLVHLQMQRAAGQIEAVTAE